jgi:beta-glucanase (GH16 family)
MAAVAGAVTPAGGAQAAVWETLVDGSSFQDRSALQAEWNFLYPWGSDHNGSARMYASAIDNNHVYLSPSGVLNLKATRITWDEGNSSADPHLPIRYHSGAVHAKDQVLVNDQFPNYEVRGEFQAPSVRGSWPAFWLTGAWSWPPESDVLEFKGDNRNWFNTYDGDWSSTIVGVGSPGSWHEYRIWMTKVNDTDVDIPHPPPRPAPYLDGQWQAAHRGTNFVGQPMWIIVNLQMEGSSGSPGPTEDIYYQARNVYVGRTNNR